MKGDTMRRVYAKKSAQDGNILAFTYCGKWYAGFFTTAELLKQSVYDKTSVSHGREPCLRFKPSMAWKREVVEAVYYFRQDDGDPIKQAREGENRGQVIERIMLETCNAIKCEKRAWWEGGDIILNASGAVMQVKYENGTVCTASQCRKIRNK